jgi:paraquat-inducible protein B
VSGLGTLLSGAFIAMRGGPHDGEKTREFVGLEQPPVAPAGEQGLRLKLHAAELYSIYVGTEVYYLRKRVGEVEAYSLAADGDGVELEIFFPVEYAHLVRKDSRFWNASGIQVSASLGKVDVSTQSLSSMLAGGIAFDSPGKSKSPAAGNGDGYWLHATRSEVDEHALRYGGLWIIVEAAHLGGVKVGDPVSYREMTVGEVISQELVADSRRLRVHLNIQDRYRKLVRTNTVFWNASGLTADLGLTGLHIRTESVQALLAGGVAFATPDPPGHLVKEGSVFKLHKEVKDKYLAWEPVLWRGPPQKSTGSEPAAAADEAGESVDESEQAEEKKAEEKKDEPGFFARFFHHESKSEEDAAKEGEPEPDAAQRDAHHEKKHGHLRR